MPSFAMEGYYREMMELQEKLRRSEEERYRLEEKFNEMIRMTRDAEQDRLRSLRHKYNRFIDDDRKRQERNKEILRTIERIESRASALSAKTERFNEIRQQYASYLKTKFQTQKVPERLTPRPSANPFQYESNPIARRKLFTEQPVEESYDSKIAKSKLNLLEQYIRENNDAESFLSKLSTLNSQLNGRNDSPDRRTYDKFFDRVIDDRNYERLQSTVPKPELEITQHFDNNVKDIRNKIANGDRIDNLLEKGLQRFQDYQMEKKQSERSFMNGTTSLDDPNKRLLGIPNDSNKSLDVSKEKLIKPHDNYSESTDTIDSADDRNWQQKENIGTKYFDPERRYLPPSEFSYPGQNLFNKNVPMFVNGGVKNNDVLKSNQSEYQDVTKEFSSEDNKKKLTSENIPKFTSFANISQQQKQNQQDMGYESPKINEMQLTGIQNGGSVPKEQYFQEMKQIEKIPGYNLKEEIIIDEQSGNNHQDLNKDNFDQIPKNIDQNNLKQSIEQNMNDKLSKQQFINENSPEKVDRKNISSIKENEGIIEQEGPQNLDLNGSQIDQNISQISQDNHEQNRMIECQNLTTQKYVGQDVQNHDVRDQNMQQYKTQEQNMEQYQKQDQQGQDTIYETNGSNMQQYDGQDSSVQQYDGQNPGIQYEGHDPNLQSYETQNLNMEQQKDQDPNMEQYEDQNLNVQQYEGQDLNLQYEGQDMQQYESQDSNIHEGQAPNMSQYDVQDPNVQQYEGQDPNMQQYEGQDPKIQQYDGQDPNIQEYVEHDSNMQQYEGQDPNTQNYPTQEPNLQQYENQDLNMQQPEIQDPNVQQYEGQDAYMKQVQDPNMQPYENTDPNTQHYENQDPNIEKYEGQDPNVQYESQDPNLQYENQDPNLQYEGQDPNLQYESQDPNVQYESQDPNQQYASQDPNQQQYEGQEVDMQQYQDGQDPNSQPYQGTYEEGQYQYDPNYVQEGAEYQTGTEIYSGETENYQYTQEGAYDPNQQFDQNYSQDQPLQSQEIDQEYPTEAGKEANQPSSIQDGSSSQQSDNAGNIEGIFENTSKSPAEKPTQGLSKLLESDTESSLKQDTKVSNDSDFDFSHG